MKKISVLVPCYNEQENVALIGSEIDTILKNELSSYNYQTIFVDNSSSV